jgi:hypothetical protein
MLMESSPARQNVRIILGHFLNRRAAAITKMQHSAEFSNCVVPGNDGLISYASMEDNVPNVVPKQR